MKSVKIFITGMGGMVGRNLAILAHQNNKTVGGTIHNTFPEELKDYPQIKKYKINLLNFSQIREAVLDFQPDVVIHLAGRVLGRNDNRASDTKIYYENIKILNNLIKAVRVLPRKARFILMSGCLVYKRSRSKIFVKEVAPEKLPKIGFAVSPYLASRIDQEKLLTKETWLDYIIARPTQICGPGKIPGVVEYFIAKEIDEALHNQNRKELHIGNKLAEVDFVDVRDAAKALLLLAEAGKKQEIYHICSSRPITVEKLFMIFFEICGLNRKEYLINSQAEKPVYFRFSSKKIRDLGWRQNYSLKETLTSYFEYFNNLKS